MMAKPSKKTPWLIVAAVALTALVGYKYFGLDKLLTLDALKASRDGLVSLYQTRPLFALSSFFAVYVVATAISFPGATILTLAAGAMFGLASG